jgi:tight adherence protein C
MLFTTFFFTITLLIYATLMARKEKKAHVNRRISLIFNKNIIQDHEDVNHIDQQSSDKAPTLVQRFITPIWREFKRSFKHRMPGEKEAKIEVRLLQAGNPFGITPVEFRLFQMAMFLILPILFIGYGVLLNMGTGSIILLLLLSIVTAAYGPHYYIKQKIKRRNHLAVKELPDVLDLLTVSLEAGLGFDSALGKVVSKKEGVLPAEFHRCLEEIRLGKTRREALSGIRDRVSIDEIKVLISSIIQAEKLGIGMVQVLRIQSNEARDKRKQRAEEEAMKAPIKMLFPLVLFIFPSLFIVLLGPALIQFLETI